MPCSGTDGALVPLKTSLYRTKCTGELAWTLTDSFLFMLTMTKSFNVWRGDDGARVMPRCGLGAKWVAPLGGSRRSRKGIGVVSFDIDVIHWLEAKGRRKKR